MIQGQQPVIRTTNMMVVMVMGQGLRWVPSFLYPM